MFNFWCECVQCLRGGVRFPNEVGVWWPSVYGGPNPKALHFQPWVGLGLLDRQALHRPHGSLAVRLKHNKTSRKYLIFFHCLPLQRRRFSLEWLTQKGLLFLSAYQRFLPISFPQCRIYYILRNMSVCFSTLQSYTRVYQLQQHKY